MATSSEMSEDLDSHFDVSAIEDEEELLTRHRKQKKELQGKFIYPDDLGSFGRLAFLAAF